MGGNRYGFDIGNSDNDSRFIERDYSIGGGVTMERKDVEHGFTHEQENLNDRIRGKMGTRRGEHFGKGPRKWRKMDSTIKEEVCEALYYNRYVDATDIEVDVQDGVVHLKGWVDSRDAKREAEHCVEDLVGVHDIRNELHMRNRKVAS
jgi:osmotically-inducible protein OsmY